MPDDLHLRAVVVDDEQLARDELCYLLDEVGGVEVVAQAGNGLEALDAIGRSSPDLVFLDVQMPGSDRIRGGQAAGRPPAARSR